MKRKLKHLGMLALAMGIISGSSLMFANKTEVQAAGGSVAILSQVHMPSLDTPEFDNDTDMMYYTRRKLFV